jgi:hypothetical protein
MARITQNKPFPNQPNIRRGAGPVNYTWNALPFQKGGVITATKHGITCNNTIDNVVTYVYDILPDGNHLAYVYCDYVM